MQLAHGASGNGGAGGSGMTGGQVVPGVVGDIVSSGGVVDAKEGNGAAGGGVGEFDTDVVAVYFLSPVCDAVGVDLATKDTNRRREVDMGGDIVDDAGTGGLALGVNVSVGGRNGIARLL